MIPIYICDDDIIMLRHLQREVENTILAEGHDMELAGAFTDPGDIIKTVERDGRQGIYFLDVDLKNKLYNGFTLAAEIRKLDSRGFLIFVTTHGELALETFRHRLEAMDYIEKDQPEKMASRLRSCLKEIEMRVLAGKRYHDALFHLISLHCSTEHLKEAKPFVKVL